MEEWDPAQVLDWVKSLGLPEPSVTPFANPKVDGRTLRKMNFDDLREFGIRSVGCRIRLLKAVYYEKVAAGCEIDDAVDYVPETVIVQREVQRTNWLQHQQGPKSGDLNSPSANFGTNASRANETQTIREREEIIEGILKDLSNSGVKTSAVQSYRQRLQALLLTRPFQDGEGAKQGTHAASTGLATTAAADPPVDAQHVTSKKGSAPPTVIKVFKNKAASSNNSEVLYKTFLVKAGRDKVSALIPVIAQKFKLGEDMGQYVLCLNDAKETMLMPDTEMLRLLSRFKGMANYPTFLIKTTALASGASNLSRKVSDASRTKATHLAEASSDVASAAASQVSTPLFTPHVPSNSAGAGLLDKSESTAALGATSKHALLPGSAKPVKKLTEHRHDHSPKSALSVNGRAVAIFDYKAKLDDELNVTVGDRFRVLRVDTGWCVVQFDGNSGSSREGTQGWVPAVVLCNEKDRPAEELISEPLHGLVLKDYEAAKNNELSVSKGEAVLVYRRYHDWLLLEGADRKGWVPSWAVQLSPAQRGSPISSQPPSATPSIATTALKPPALQKGRDVSKRSVIHTHKKTVSQSSLTTFKSSPASGGVSPEKKSADGASQETAGQPENSKVDQPAWTKKAHRRSQSSSVTYLTAPPLTLDLPDDTSALKFSPFPSDLVLDHSATSDAGSRKGSQSALNPSEGSLTPSSTAMRKTFSESSLGVLGVPLSSGSAAASSGGPRSGNLASNLVEVGRRVDSISGSPVLEFASPKPSSTLNSIVSSGAKLKLDFLMETVNQLFDDPKTLANQQSLGLADKESALALAKEKEATETGKLDSALNSGSLSDTNSSAASSDSLGKLIPSDPKHSLSVGMAVDLLNEVSANTEDKELKALVEAVLEKMVSVPRQSAIPNKLEPLVKKLALLSGINIT